MFRVEEAGRKCSCCSGCAAALCSASGSCPLLRRRQLREEAAAAPRRRCGGCFLPDAGTIVSVNDISAGQTVKKGDVLVVLEAMKMENEIMAPHDATVAVVHVNKGDSVDSGTALVSLSKNNGLGLMKLIEGERKKIGITETVLRDAHQSLIATRMPIDDMLPILDKMDKVGFHSLECWGGEPPLMPAFVF